MTGLEPLAEVRGIDAHPLEVAHHPSPHDVTPREGAVVIGPENAELYELADAIRRRAAAARQLSFREAVARRVRVGDERVTACIGAEPIALTVVLGRRHGVVRVDPHPADRVHDDGHRFKRAC